MGLLSSSKTQSILCISYLYINAVVRVHFIAYFLCFMFRREYRQLVDLSQ